MHPNQESQSLQSCDEIVSKVNKGFERDARYAVCNTV